MEWCPECGNMSAEYNTGCGYIGEDNTKERETNLFNTLQELKNDVKQIKMAVCEVSNKKECVD